MKRFLLLLTILLAGSIASAKQRVECYRYISFKITVADDAKADLEKLISQGFKIVGFSLDCNQRCMVVVYDDMNEASE